MWIDNLALGRSAKIKKVSVLMGLLKYNTSVNIGCSRSNGNVEKVERKEVILI